MEEQKITHCDTDTGCDDPSCETCQDKGKPRLMCHNCQCEQPMDVYPSGPHQRADCAVCGKYVKFMKVEKPIENEIFHFGKYVGIKMITVAQQDPEYLKWLFNTSDSNNLKEKITRALEYVSRAS